MFALTDFQRISKRGQSPQLHQFLVKLPNTSHIECVYACACLGFSICLLAHVDVYLFYMGTTVYACKYVCVCVCVVGVGARVEGECMCVNTVCT